MIFLSTSRVYPTGTLNALTYDELDTRLEPAAEQEVPGVSREGVTEDFPLEGARSFYGATKLCSELVIAEYADAYRMPVIINRCGVLTGPWQMGKIDQGVAVLWAARHVFGGALKYIGYGGAGKQVRDMLHIDDLIRLLRHEVTHLHDLSGKIFNVGGGRERSVSLQELTRICQGATGNTIAIGSDPKTRAADVPWYVTDNTRVATATGWKPSIGCETMMDDIVRWIRDNRDQLAHILS